MLERFYTGVVRFRKIIFVLFIVLAVAGALMRPLVGVNYDMKDYLPEESLSTRALNVMQKEFGGNMPNCRVMIKDVSYREALQYKEKIEEVDGVEQVMWLDSSMLLADMPLDFVDRDTMNTYFRLHEDSGDQGVRKGDALMNVTVDKDKRQSAVPAIRKVIGDDNCMTGDAVSTAVATEQTVKEIAKTAAASVLLVLVILFLTTRAWVDPIIILAGIGVAILINNGTNLIFGEISFVTNASGSILQLAVSLDYSVFLIHRFEECMAARSVSSEKPGAGTLPSAATAESAMVEALCKCTGSIASSGLTTVIGFLALILMRYKIGPDMGLALAKGVAISLITVFTFTPAMILIMRRWSEKTRHRNLLPDFAGFGRFVRRGMIPAVIVFALVVVPSFLLSNRNSYYFGASHIFGPGTQVGDDKDEIRDVFGSRDTYAVLVPRGDYAKESELTEKLKAIPEITAVTSYSEMIGHTIPSDVLPNKLVGLLVSDHYERMVLSVDAEYEGEETFDLVRKLRRTCADVYGDDYYLAGEGVSTYDLMDTVTSDMLKINLAAVLAVFIILVIMFRKILLPLLLVLSIETAIWINVAIPGLFGSPVFYIAYLIISSVQLGATVDYAILFTDRYRENRLSMDRRDAVVATVRNVTASICTSGSALIIVGFLMGILSSHGILAQLGIFIGRGAICSLIIVFFALPGLLYLFDRFVVKKQDAPCCVSSAP